MMSTAFLPSRAQFAFAVSFHIFFRSFTIGLRPGSRSSRRFHLISGKPVYRRLFELWLKIFGVTFGLGL
jgi:cytochrome bd ubiquinol oxidase subunit I